MGYGHSIDAFPSFKFKRQEEYHQGPFKIHAWTQPRKLALRFLIALKSARTEYRFDDVQFG